MITKIRTLFKWQKVKSGRPSPLLLVMPHVCFGGAERWAAAIVRELHDEGHAVILAVVGEKTDEANAVKAWFSSYVKEVHFADEWARSYPGIFLNTLIEQWNISVLVLVGQSSAYSALPRLHSLRAALHIVSFQFNAVDLCQEHLRYAPFINAVVVEGQDVADHLVSNGFSRAKIFQIPSAIHLLASSLIQPKIKEKDRIRVGFIGRMDNDSKNPRGFTQMAELLDLDNLHFILIGDGPEAEGIEQWIQVKAGQISMELIRHVSDHLLGQHLSALDILVVPSLRDGRPLIIREAQALGKPVIASRVGSIPDLISDGKTGILCEPGCAPEFAEAVQHLVKNPALRQQMGDAGYQHVKRESDIRRTMPLLKNVFFGFP